MSNRRTEKAPASAGVGPGLALQFDPAALQPLISQVVEATLTRLETDRAQVGDKLCYSEEEAAALLELETHVLRDERRRGRIQASAIVGRRIRYMREDLMNYLRGRRCP